MVSSHDDQENEEDHIEQSNENEVIQLETDNDNNNHEIQVEMIVPPDGGWGWVIVAASFMCNFFVDGVVFSFGLFLTQIAQAFSVSKARVALVGSLQTGFYLMSGPFVSALANKYGFRPVAILGSVISCLAFIISFFSQSIGDLSIAYGVLGGLGAGLIYVPAVITTGFYFERWRALATGISVCGSGIGAFLLAPFTDFVINLYGWRGALLIHAGLLLNCAVFGALFRALEPTRIKVNRKSEMTGINSSAQSIDRAVSFGTLSASQPTVRRLIGWNINTDYPTAAQLIGSSPDVMNTISSHSLHKELQAATKNARRLSKSEKRLSAPIYPEPDILMDPDLKTVEEENNLLAGDLERLGGRIPTIRRHTVSGRHLRVNSDAIQKSYRLNKRGHPSRDTQRPFYRDDIFYGGSLHRLPHYKSQVSSVGYHMSVTRLRTQKDVEEEDNGKFCVFPESVRRILTTMLDVTLLKSPSFLILALSGFFTMMGFYTPFLYLPDRAKIAGIDASSATFLVSVIGITNTIGRVVCGVLSTLPGMDALLINNLFISISGVATILSGISYSKGYQFFYSALFGLSISAFASLRSILVVELMGLEKLTNAFGLLLLFQGVAAAVGTPLSGLFMDITGSYDTPFYISGAFLLLSGVICYPLGRINRWEKRRAQDNA